MIRSISEYIMTSCSPSHSNLLFRYFVLKRNVNFLSRYIVSCLTELGKKSSEQKRYFILNKYHVILLKYLKFSKRNI